MAQHSTESGCSQSPAVATFFGLKPIQCLTNASRLSAVKKNKKTTKISSPSNAILDKTATGPATIVSRRPHGHRPSSRRPRPSLHSPGNGAWTTGCWVDIGLRGVATLDVVTRKRAQGDARKLVCGREVEVSSSEFCRGSAVERGTCSTRARAPCESGCVAPHMAGRVGLPPSEYRLLSEMSASSGPSVPRSRSV